MQMQTFPRRKGIPVFHGSLFRKCAATALTAFVAVGSMGIAAPRARADDSTVAASVFYPIQNYTGAAAPAEGTWFFEARDFTTTSGAIADCGAFMQNVSAGGSTYNSLGCSSLSWVNGSETSYPCYLLSTDSDQSLGFRMIDTGSAHYGMSLRFKAPSDGLYDTALALRVVDHGSPDTIYYRLVKDAANGNESWVYPTNGQPQTYSIDTNNWTPTYAMYPRQVYLKAGESVRIEMWIKTQNNWSDVMTVKLGRPFISRVTQAATAKGTSYTYAANPYYPAYYVDPSSGIGWGGNITMNGRWNFDLIQVNPTSGAATVSQPSMFNRSWGNMFYNEVSGTYQGVGYSGLCVGTYYYTDSVRFVAKTGYGYGTSMRFVSPQAGVASFATGADIGANDTCHLRVQKNGVTIYPSDGGWADSLAKDTPVNCTVDVGDEITFQFYSTSTSDTTSDTKDISVGIPTVTISPDTISASLSGGTLTATVDTPVAGNAYQIWAYQRLPKDIDGTPAEDEYLWVPMVRTDNHTFTLSPATADSNGAYQFYMVETDGDGNVLMRSFDSAALGLADTTAKIGKITLGGSPVSGKVSVNLGDTAQQTQNICIVAENARGYTLSYGPNQLALAADTNADPTGGTFPVNFKSIGPGVYVFTATATGSDDVADTRSFTVQVYDPTDSSTGYAEISNMTNDTANNLVGSDGRLRLTLSGASSLNVAFGPNDLFRYRFSAGEPGRSTVAASAVSTAGPSATLTFQKYGFYLVYATAARSETSSYDDAIIRYFNYKRPNGSVRLTSLTASENGGAPVNGTSQAGTAGNAYSFNAQADSSVLQPTGESLLYSYWRDDASGWVLLKDWSADPTLVWTPALAGNYVIQARVKGSQAGSYEDEKTIGFSIAPRSSDKQTTQVSALTMTVSGSSPRQPVLLTANAVRENSSDILYYRFIVQDGNLGAQIIQAYSPSNVCSWIPRKAGVYSVTAQIINQNSFGMYDRQTDVASVNIH